MFECQCWYGFLRYLLFACKTFNLQSDLCCMVLIVSSVVPFSSAEVISEEVCRGPHTQRRCAVP